MVSLQSIEGSNSLKIVQIRGPFSIENCVEITTINSKTWLRETYKKLEIIFIKRC